MKERCKTPRGQPDLAFRTARLDYCIRLYESEELLKERSARKTQFYFSITAILLGVAFLKERLPLAGGAAGQHIDRAADLLLLFEGALGLLLLVTLFALLRVVAVREYLRPFPEHLLSALFLPSSRFNGNKTESDLIDSIAILYASAVERNHLNNEVKVRWLKIASFTLTCSLVAGAAVLTLASLSAASQV